MARKPSAHVEISGPLFDGDTTRRVHAAVDRGLLDLAEQGERYLKDELRGALRVQTGRYVGSIEAGRKASLSAGVRSVDTLRRKTFLETGRRNGVKTRRKGGWYFRHTATRLQREDPTGFILPYIVKALD